MAAMRDELDATILTDLTDSRRAAKTWLPADDRDVTNGLVVSGPHGKPACVRHGAMNRVDAHRSVWKIVALYEANGGQWIWALRALAAIDADHPDYKQEWA